MVLSSSRTRPVATRAGARHITQLKWAICLRRIDPDDAVMAARQVLAREKAAGIQCVIAECRWLSFLKHPKHYVRNHFKCGALFSSFPLSIRARRVRTSSCHDLLEAADSASLCLQAT